MKIAGWIGVDLDGTLAKYDQWRGVQHIGDPVPLMVDRAVQVEENTGVVIGRTRRGLS